MKNVFLLAVLISFFVNSSSASVAFNPNHLNTGNSKIQNSGIFDKQLFTAEDIINSDRKTIETKIGKKLSFKERIVLGIVKHQLKKAEKKGKLAEAWKETSGDTGSDLIIGVVLGVLLGLIGVLIAYIIGRKDIIKGSWYGLLAIIALVLIIYVIAAAKVK